MSQQDGYTAAEALAALAILGLAMGGLTTSMGLITASQTKARARVEQSVFERAADQRLERLIARDAPFRSDQTTHLVGARSALEVDCGDGRRCAARIENDALIIRDGRGEETRLRLPDGEAPSFRYIGSYSASDLWPPAPLPPPAPAWQTLNAIAIVSKNEVGERPLVVAKIWRQQRADCEYDVVIQDCRGGGS